MAETGSKGCSVQLTVVLPNAMGSGNSKSKNETQIKSFLGTHANAFASLYLRNISDRISRPNQLPEDERAKQQAAIKIQAMWKLTHGRSRRMSLLFDDEEGGQEDELGADKLAMTQMTAEAIDAAEAEDAEEAEYRDDKAALVTNNVHIIEGVISIKELLNIINHGDLERLETMFEQMTARNSAMDWLNMPLDVNTKQHALHFCVNQGGLEILKRFLLEPKIDVNVKQAIGRTPLMWATTAGNIEVLEELIAHKDIMVNMTDNNSKTVRVSF